MKFLPLIWAYMSRRKIRTVFTILSVAAAFLMYGLLVSTKQAVEGGAEIASADRLLTMPKMSILQSLPLKYEERIKSIKGVADVAHISWFGGYYQEAKNSVSSMAISGDAYFDIYPEIVISNKEKKDFLDDPIGAVIGRLLAEQYGWKIGDKIPLRSSIWRNKAGNNVWEVVIRGIYDVNISSGDTTSLVFHYDYFNEGRISDKDTVWWYSVKAVNAEQVAGVAKAIDSMFENSAYETKTSSEKAFVQAMIKQFGDVGSIVLIIYLCVFLSMLLVVGNGLAYSVKERTGELAVLSVIGFSKLRIIKLVLSESLLISIVGGGLGLLIAYLIAYVLRMSMGQYLPGFELTATALMVGGGLIVTLAVVAALTPIYLVSQLKLVNALRG